MKMKIHLMWGRAPSPVPPSAARRLAAPQMTAFLTTNRAHKEIFTFIAIHKSNTDASHRSCPAPHSHSTHAQAADYVKHIHSPWMRPQTPLQVRHHSSQPRFWKRVKEVEHAGLGRKRELGCIRANRFQRKA